MIFFFFFTDLTKLVRMIESGYVANIYILENKLTYRENISPAVRITRLPQKIQPCYGTTFSTFLLE